MYLIQHEEVMEMDDEEKVVMQQALLEVLPLSDIEVGMGVCRILLVEEEGRKHLLDEMLR